MLSWRGAQATTPAPPVTCGAGRLPGTRSLPSEEDVIALAGLGGEGETEERPQDASDDAVADDEPQEERDEAPVKGQAARLQDHALAEPGHQHREKDGGVVPVGRCQDVAERVEGAPYPHGP